jgi:hypothetical protein
MVSLTADAFLSLTTALRQGAEGHDIANMLICITESLSSSLLSSS